MSAPDANSDADALPLSQTDAEMQEGRRQVERRAAQLGQLPKNAIGATDLHGGKAIGPTGIVTGPGDLTGCTVLSLIRA